MKKKLLSIVAIIVTNSLFSQLTLEHSFQKNEFVSYYTKDNTMFYIGDGKGYLKIYNADYSLKKTINIPIASNYSTYLRSEPFAVSKHIFNSDDKYEFMVNVYYNDQVTLKYYSKLLLINEDGELLKDFHPNAGTINGGSFDVYHDSVSNKNKVLILNYNATVGAEDQYDVYSLPTSILTTKEIQEKSKLSAFPIPTSKVLNIINPRNRATNIEVYDTNGKLVINKSFAISENTISLDVEKLSPGNYVYKIGDLSAKFIKY